MTRNINILGAIGVTLFLLASPGAASAQVSNDSRNREITIHNDSEQAVYSMYYTNTYRSDWGSDRLGADVISSGDDVDWNVDDGGGYCLYDFKFVMRDSSVQTLRRFNVCAHSDVYVGG
jgi:hypothetical protein